MKALYLMRHAKSDSATPGNDDFDRPLNQRGREDCVTIGAELRRRGAKPDFVLHSPARRAAETWQCLAADDWDAQEIDSNPDLYLADAGEVLAAIRAVPDRCGTLLVIGHNPGLHDLAKSLSGRDSTAESRELTMKFPTAATAFFSSTCLAWQEFGHENVEFQGFISPGSLAG
jgi:phosphohistidine phosphatase